MEWAVDVLMNEDAATPLAASSTAESTAVVGLARLMLSPADAQMTRLALSTSAAIGAAQSTGFSAYRLDGRFWPSSPRVYMGGKGPSGAG